LTLRDFTVFAVYGGGLHGVRVRVPHARLLSPHSMPIGPTEKGGPNFPSVPSGEGTPPPEINSTAAEALPDAPVAVVDVDGGGVDVRVVWANVGGVKNSLFLEMRATLRSTRYWTVFPGEGGGREGDRERREGRRDEQEPERETGSR